MDIRHLRYFMAMVEGGSLSEASRRLHVAQPALSQRLADLEQELEVQLFVRGPSGIAVTEAGTELYARAAAIVKQLESARAAVREKAGHAQGCVSIGILKSVAPIVATPLYLAIKQELPAVTPEIVVGYSDELRQRLRASQLDIAMQVHAAHEKCAPATLLYRERLCLVGPRPLVDLHPAPIRLEQLSGIPLILSSMQPSHRMLREEAARRGVALDIVGGIEDSKALLDVCATGTAATLLAESVAARRAGNAGLAYAPLDEPRLTRQVVVALNDSVMKTGAIIAAEAILARLLRERLEATLP
ncbi:LysR family transcriptional regulator [Pigmentiphaga sp. H8]|uniref:LysR family transcriptional regulator n=1 Tax=Pigmentiphaga sp. H8 TaxID=2488560 RepID=UPI000F5A9BE0|nr:LysR family transcriptional regulator [Pigmentiphaga sp. H8]AZG06618.1 LysR family transcriptional regulator [Pigmentiphaga sp. H8]